MADRAITLRGTDAPAPLAPGLGRTLRHWRTVRRTRRALLALDDARLADIGLDRSAALAEARRPFWR